MVFALVLHLAAALAAAECGDQTKTTILAWQARLDDAELEPPSRPNAVAFRIPTAELGQWARVTIASGRVIEVMRLRRSDVERVTWMEGCRAAGDAQTLTPADMPWPRFTDEDLRMAADAGPGVVYLWSPHMPLSVEGMAHARQAARERGVQFIAVLDPGADLAYARSTAERHGLPTDALARADSLELELRGLMTHAPSLLVFAKGRVAGAPLPGFRSPVDYADFIERSVRRAP